MRKSAELIGSEVVPQSESAECDAPAIRIGLRVGNYAHLLRAFGLVATRCALDDLKRALVARLDPMARVIVSGDGTLEVQAGQSAFRNVKDTSSAQASGLKAFFDTFTTYCADTPSGPVLLSIAGLWVEGEQAVDADFERLSEEGSQPVFQGDPPGSGRAWSERYCADMSLAIDLFRSLGEEVAGGLVLDQMQQRPLQYAVHWQPVRSTSKPGDVLYYETLLRLVDERGAIQVPQNAVAAVERLGFNSVLDRLGLRAVIADLQASPGISLGVKVSARSLADTCLWHEILAILASDVSLAPRLIIEVTQDASISDVRGAVQQLDLLKQRGAIIALEGFGSGLASIRQLLAVAPQIVKVDRLFLRCAGRSAQDHARLRLLIALAATVAPVVVADGVETEEQSRFASDAGADWQQGDFMGRSGFFRPWRASVLPKASGATAWRAPRGVIRGGLS